MKVWVDIESGTYGEEDADKPSIYLVDVEETDYNMIALDNMLDMDRAKWAQALGIPLRMVGCHPKNVME